MRSLLIALGILLGAQVVFGDEVTRSVQDVTAIVNEEGAGRVLFRLNAPLVLTDVAVHKATLRFAASGEQESRSVTLLLHPVNRAWSRGSVSWTSPWTRPGGDFDQLYAKREWSLSRGSQDLVFDVTLLVKEMVEHGLQSDGFLLTVDPAEGEGLVSADRTRLAGLSSATLEVQYRHMPSVVRRG